MWVVVRITFSFLEFYKDSNVNRQALAIVGIVAHHPGNVIHVHVAKSKHVLGMSFTCAQILLKILI